MRFLVRLRPALLSALLLLSSLLLPLLFSQPASATSAYDDYYVMTPTLNIGGGSTCSTSDDRSLNWNTESWIKSSWNYTNNYNSAQSAVNSFWTTLQSRIGGSGDGWFVGQNKSGNSWGDGANGDTITIGYLNDGVTADLSSQLSLSAGSYTILTLYYNGGAGCRLQMDTSSYSTGVGTVSNLATFRRDIYNISPGGYPDDASIYLLNTTVTYPSGYAGTDIWSEGGGPSAIVLRPDFTYTVDNKAVSAHDDNIDLPTVTPDSGYTIAGYSVEWSLFKCNPYVEPPSATCTSPELVNYQILAQDSDYNYTVSDYADYTLSAQYLVQECYRYPSYPATPDYCFYVDLGAELGDGYDLTSTTVYLGIDGSSLSGDTGSYDCDVSGFCDPPGTVCYEITDFFSRMNCEMTKQLNFGVVNPSINAIKSLLLSFTIPDDPTCDIPLPDVTIATGEVFPLSDYSDSACTQAETFRDSFPISTVLVNFFFAITIILLIIRIINRLTDNTKNDLIEGL